jgi:hypothetical protein
MKIALCISGQPRSLVGGCALMKKFLIEPSSIEDIFVHLWYDPSMDGKPFNSSQPHLQNKIGTWLPGSDQYVKDQLNPTRMLIEPQASMEEFSHLEDVPGRANQKALASMFCSVTKANNLRKDYEIKNNVKYDIVVRSRIDHTYYKPVDVRTFFKEADKDCVYVPQNHQYMRDHHYLIANSGLNYASMSETFIFASPENMDKVCEVFPNFEKIYEDIYPENFAEQYIGYQVRGIHKIQVVSVDAPYDIYRGI